MSQQQPPPPGSGQQPGAPGGPRPGYPGAPGHPGGPGAPFGPPRKSRTGLIIALVVVGVVLLAGLGVAGLLALSVDSETTGSEKSAASESAGGDVTGDGYHFSLPDGWQDISEGDEVSSQPTLDTGAANAETIEQSSANVLVERLPASGGSAEQLRDQLRTTYESQFEAEVEDLPDRDIGGESTYALTMTRPSTTDPSLDVEQVSYVAVLDDAGYVITSSRVVDFPGTEAEVDAILDSWAWE